MNSVENYNRALSLVISVRNDTSHGCCARRFLSYSVTALTPTFWFLCWCFMLLVSVFCDYRGLSEYTLLLSQVLGNVSCRAYDC